MMVRRISPARPRWWRTGSGRFPLAARVGGQWWVLRLNPFPDHDLWTLFIDGAARYDLNDAPPSWGVLAPASVPPLDPWTADSLLAPLSEFVVYGSEAGQPCDDPFCCG
ncbi:hypothetical protein [Nocardia carnea]|uniref:hypothetical protein n=1 Tax=Nocardia carnea TaxID=37328 RepID=UPI0024542967|nr:hypothetical protein [Nocardia carnea]